MSPGGGGLGNTTHAGGQAVFNRRYAMKLDLDNELISTDPYGSALDEAVQANLSAAR